MKAVASVSAHVIGLVLLVVKLSAQSDRLATPLDLYLPTPDSVATQSLPQSESVVRPIDIESWPVFCRLEEIASRQAKTQIRVRLGSVDYVNYLEGKSSAPAQQ